MAKSKLGPLALEVRLGDAHSHFWRAIHVDQRVTLAVKVFSIPFLNSPEARKQLVWEWEALKLVQSPGMARCYGGGFEDNDAYLAYEWLDGENLKSQISRRERLPWDLVLDYADQLIEGLIAAHERQIFHGSIEPDKVMCLSSGVAKLLDLRVDRFGSPYQSQRPPTDFQLAFRPPELLAKDPLPNAKSDIYSLGAVLFYAVTGTSPITAKTPAGMLDAIREQRPPKAATIAMDCPVWFSSLIDQLLEKDPQARPFGAAAVRLALQEVRQRAMNGTSVSDHAAGGFSALKLGTDRNSARQLLGRIEQEVEEPIHHDRPPIHERWWFLVGCLGFLIGIIIWFMLPPSSDKLRRSAETLLASDDLLDRKRAQTDYLEPLLRLDPEGPHSVWAKGEIDEIEIDRQLAQLDRKLMRGTALENEGERLYAEARRFEQFGDLLTALDKYKAMSKVLESRNKIVGSENRLWVKAAGRKIAQIESEGSARSNQRKELVMRKMSDAEQLISAGKKLEAKVLLQAIVELYGENAELRPLVDRAHELIAGLSS